MDEFRQVWRIGLKGEKQNFDLSVVNNEKPLKFLKNRSNMFVK